LLRKTRVKKMGVALRSYPPARDPAGVPGVPMPWVESRRASCKHGSEVFNAGDVNRFVVHVDAETLRDGVAGRCEFEEGPSLAAETARRLACDASYCKRRRERTREPLNVGRKTRSVPPALRRALNARDHGCRFPGCSNTRYVRCPSYPALGQGRRDKAVELGAVMSFSSSTGAMKDESRFRFSTTGRCAF